MGTGRPGRSKLEDPVWIALLERYVAGEVASELADEHGVSVEAVAWQARNRGYRKKDRPGAVYRWSQPPPITPAPDPVVARGFAFDPLDLEGSEARALESARRAADEGRLPDFLALTQSARGIRRLKERGALPPPPPSAVPLPQEGEEKCEPVLRDAQRAPAGDWTTWLFLGGRGAGKTLAGAVWLADQAERLGAGGRLALIGGSLHDVREVMVEGVSGIASLARWNDPKWCGVRPVFEPSRKRLVFPNGAVAQAFSAEDPEALRGPQFAAAWADEFCAWPRGGRGGRGGPGATLALLRMGLRLGERPRLVVTTTPKPIGALRDLRAEPGLVQTHAATRDNAENLAAGFVEGLERLYGGTRKAAQELEGRVVDVEGALFSAEMLARARSHPAGGYRPSGYLSPRTPGGDSPDAGDGGVGFDRIVVAIDPTTTAGGNACGIVVAARAGDRAHVLADRSVAGLGPDGWARRAVRAAEAFGAIALVVEVNQGGEMVRAVLKTAGCSVRIREVRATKGKRIRAEPVAALYEQGRVTHAPGLGALEEELMAIGGEDGGAWGLDRADALVWALTDLLIDRSGGEGPRIRMLDWPAGRPGLSMC
ncbi:DNA-packaging protein [Brevundimonas subvibrioides]|uniref:DNA-packaging protein n=1 Tax=Brevundimonas subvibrioides TaxID=74313 RepID=UPI0022B3419E|nr:terminase family protein [Brevundimonas subvibrioides]